MPVLTARTLAEAQLYINLTVEGGRPGEYEELITPIEGPTSWSLRHEQGEIEVPYLSEEEARQSGERFGSGRSELLDAGQWQLVSAGYARRALADDLEYTLNPSDREKFDNVVLSWEFARDAAMEVVKFVPPGTAAAPDTAFWTETGAAARRAEPGRFTRAQLIADIALPAKPRRLSTPERLGPVTKLA